MDKDIKRLNYLMIILLLVGLAFGVKCSDIQTARQASGLISLSFGYILLFGYILAQLLKLFKLPLITGYIYVILTMILIYLIRQQAKVILQTSIMPNIYC